MPPSHPLRTSRRRTGLMCLLLLLLSTLAVSHAPQAFAEDAVKEDRYPMIPLKLLEGDQQARFLKIAQAELCPCEGVFDSLDACLQKENAGCSLAFNVATLAMRKLKEGESDSDVVDAIVKQIERARKVYTFDLDGVPHKGAAPEKAKLTIVEFADFQCPHCARGSKTLRDVVKKHGDEITIYFLQFPLPGHPHSRLAARASLAAHQQGKFWELHDLMMDNQSTLSPDNITAYAQMIGLNMDRFNADINDKKIETMIDASLQIGTQVELTGTPSFFINGIRFEDSLEDLEKTIDERLKK